MNRPVLILLCGIPGSGKTTYAEKMKNSYTYCLSSDSIRKELYGDESTQGNPADVFTLMQDRAIMLLNNGFDVIYDATNITRKDRASILTKCPKFVQVECHIIWAPIEICIERDATRERTVGKEVIDRMLKRFQAPYYDEGINKIKVILPDGFNTDEYEKECMSKMQIPHDNQHQCTGSWMAYGLMVDPFVVWLISTHMAPFLNEKYYKNLPPYLKNSVDLLHEADVHAH